MFANCHVSASQLAGNNFMAFAGVLVANPQHIGRQMFAKPLMQPAGISGRGRPCGWVATFVDQLLDVNVGHGLQLEVVHFRLVRKISFQGTFNVPRMGVVTFDKV